MVTGTATPDWSAWNAGTAPGATGANPPGPESHASQKTFREAYVGARWRPLRSKALTPYHGSKAKRRLPFGFGYRREKRRGLPGSTSKLDFLPCSARAN